MTISRKKWGRSTTKTEKIIREAIPKDGTLKEIDEYLKNTRSITSYDLVKRFNIRVSVARKILREKEENGEIIPYIRESGFVAYTTPSELEKTEGSQKTMIADAFEEVASSVDGPDIITDEMDEALVETSIAIGAVKPSRLARKRREKGKKKERRDTRPEVVVEPIAAPASSEPVKEEIEEPVKKKVLKKKPKKKPTKKKAEKKKPEKKAPKKKKKPEKKAPKKKMTDIPGLGAKTVEKLHEAGIKTVAKLSKAKPDELSEKVDGISEDGAAEFIAAAQELVPPKKKPKTKKKAKKKKAKKKAPKKKMTDIPGLGAKTVEKLHEAGIKTVAKLSKAKPDELSEKVDGISEDGAAEFIAAAQELVPHKEKSKSKKATKKS